MSNQKSFAVVDMVSGKGMARFQRYRDAKAFAQQSTQLCRIVPLTRGLDAPTPISYGIKLIDPDRVYLLRLYHSLQQVIV